MTTLVPPTTDTLAITIAELDKRFNVHMDECDRRLGECFATQQASVDRAIAAQQASVDLSIAAQQGAVALAAEALKQVAASANSQMAVFNLRMDSVYSRLVTTIMFLSISFFVLGAFSFVHAFTGH